MTVTYMAEKGKIGKLELKNRIVFPPVNNNFTRAGYMTDESIEFYVARARGGCGLVIVEATSVDYPRSRSVLNPSIDDDKFIPAMKKIADGCHQYGAKCMVQISHVGRQTRKAVTGMDPIAPSAISSKADMYPDTPKVLTVPEIQEVVEMFGAGALRCQKAGMDGVEVIMGHGYLVNNFLCPVSNHRTDEYAGIKGGIRFATEIIKKIKERCGADFPVVCRYNIDDCLIKDGNGPVEAQLIAQALEKAGCDCINASAAMRDSDLNYGDHTSGSPLGAWLHFAERIRRVVSIPVMAVKRLTPDIAEEALRKGQADFICFGKQLIADPDFANKILENRPEDALHCSSCCQGCYDVLWQKLPITCMINPAVGRKEAYLKERAARKGNKKVLVVGAGPAGCETALEAAKKGHKVVLIDRADRIGGMYISTALTKCKHGVAKVFENMNVALRKIGVDIRLNTSFSEKVLAEIQPQVVVDATGSDFQKAKIEGADLPHVITPVEAIDGYRDIGQYVVIIACGHRCTWTCKVVSHPIPDDIVGLQTAETHACTAGHAAADVAEELALRGKKVSVITERDTFVPGMGFTNRGNMIKRYFQEGVTVANNIKVKKILPDHILCERDGMEFKVCADTVVISDSVRACGGIEEIVKKTNAEFYKAGDAATIGNALFAFHSGYEIVDSF